MSKKALFYNCKNTETTEFENNLKEFGYEITKTEKQIENIDDFEIVCVNLTETINSQNAEFETSDIIKSIDTTGAALLQNSAKMHENIACATDEEDYKNIITELKTLGEVSPTLRESLAIKAFETAAIYNADVSKSLRHEYKLEAQNLFLAAKRLQPLEYGENRHQRGNLYDTKTGFEYQILNDKELKYTDILDITASLDVVSEFFDVPACVISNRGIPCGAALGKDLQDAYEKAFDCNAIASMNGTAAFSQTVTREIALHAKNAQLHAIAAPAFDDEALKILKTSQKTIIMEIKTPLNEYKNILLKEYKATPFGLLEQDCDKKDLDAGDFAVKTETKPTKEQVEDLIFAFKIAKHLKSNGLVIAKDFKAIAIENGYSCLQNAVEGGLNGAVDGTKEAVMCLNGGDVTLGTLNASAQGRISAILYPNEGNIQPTIFERSDKFKIAFIETKTTHYKY